MSVNQVVEFKATGTGATPMVSLLGGVYVVSWLATDWGTVAMQTQAPCGNWLPCHVYTTDGSMTVLLGAANYRFEYTDMTDALIFLCQQPPVPTGTLGPPGPTFDISALPVLPYPPAASAAVAVQSGVGTYQAPVSSFLSGAPGESITVRSGLGNTGAPGNFFAYAGPDTAGPYGGGYAIIGGGSSGVHSKGAVIGLYGAAGNNGDGGAVNIGGGASDYATGGAIVGIGGQSASGVGGAIRFTAGQGAGGGAVSFIGGYGTSGTLGGNVDINPGAGTDGITAAGMLQVNANPSLMTTTFSWQAGDTLDDRTVYTAGRVVRVTAIILRIDAANGSAATLTVNKAAHDVAYSAGVALSGDAIDLNAAAKSVQSLTLSINIADLFLQVGESIGLLLASGDLTSTAGSLTIHMTPQ